jgi:chromosome segregation ATPase
MLQSNRLQLPQEGTYIGFDNSISYSLDSVKGLDEKFLENLKENLSVRYLGRGKTMDENKISSIIKESITEATAPIVEKVDGVAEQIEILANRVNEQDALITQLVEDNDNKSQIITEQRGIIDEQQATIDELKKELEKALTENKQLKDEKALADDVLKNVSDKLLLAVPQFEHKDYASQYAEMGELLSDVEFIPADKVHEQKVENAMLKGELTDTKQTLSDIQAELKTVKTENVSLRQEIDRLVSRAEKVMTATIDEPDKAEETDRGNDTPGKEGKSDIDIFER